MAAEPGEAHGWTTAKCDYYYKVIRGFCIVYVNGSEHFVALEGDSFMIEAGAEFNYIAGDRQLSLELFANRLFGE